MKTLKIAKNLVYVFALIFIMAACTSDQIEIDEEQTVTENSFSSTKSSGDKVLIEWELGTPEKTKQEYRDYYKDEGILLSYVDCKDKDGKYETWHAKKDSDPIDPDKPQSCCMAKVLYDKDCSDID